MEMENSLFKVKRKSVMELGEIYFWTATIHKWITLLQTDSAKDMRLNSLQYLSTKDKIDVYAYKVILTDYNNKLHEYVGHVTISK